MVDKSIKADSKHAQSLFSCDTQDEYSDGFIIFREHQKK